MLDSQRNLWLCKCVLQRSKKITLASRREAVKNVRPKQEEGKNKRKEMSGNPYRNLEKQNEGWIVGTIQEKKLEKYS